MPARTRSSATCLWYSRLWSETAAYHTTVGPGTPGANWGRDTGHPDGRDTGPSAQEGLARTGHHPGQSSRDTGHRRANRDTGTRRRGIAFSGGTPPRDECRDTGHSSGRDTGPLVNARLGRDTVVSNRVGRDTGPTRHWDTSGCVFLARVADAGPGYDRDTDHTPVMCGHRVARCQRKPMTTTRLEFANGKRGQGRVSDMEGHRTI